MRESDHRHGEWRRARHSRRKERVLHTRITDQLADDIRKVAEDLRVPVSNLVRNVLEEVFSVVEQVSDDMGDLVDDVVEEAERARERLHRFNARRRDREAQREARGEDEPRAERPGASEPGGSPAQDPLAQEFPEVVAWQPVLLNRDQRCAATGRALSRGESAHVGLTARGLSDIYLSDEAIRARSRR